jgi:hypothetical protein
MKNPKSNGSIWGFYLQNRNKNILKLHEVRALRAFVVALMAFI